MLILLGVNPVHNTNIQSCGIGSESASFWEAGSGSTSSGILDPDLHQNVMQDPDPHHSEKVNALEGQFGVPIVGYKSGKCERKDMNPNPHQKGRIRIRIRTKVKIIIRIRI